MSFTVAIDGPAAAGKGTIARAVALHFGLTHLDTGLIYRAVGKRILELGGDVDERAIIAIAEMLKADDLTADGLRSLEVAQAASRAAAIPSVRRTLVDFQRQFAMRPEGTVLDGRDIGTVIFPNADVKIFVTATARTRAKRRFNEMRSKGEDVTLEEIERAVRARDKLDAEREVAPMRPAEDAHLLDTTDLSIDRAIKAAIAFVDAAYRPLNKLNMSLK